MFRDHCVAALVYLCAIASNVTADFVSNCRKRVEHELTDSQLVERWVEDPENATPDFAEQLSLEHQLESALERLPRLEAAALVLRYQLGLTNDEIAIRLSLSPGSIDKYLTRGKARMRILLRKGHSAALGRGRIRP